MAADINRRLLMRGLMGNAVDYPYAEAATVTDPQNTFYGTGYENLLQAKPPGNHPYENDTNAVQTHALIAAALASNRSPLMGLGFDPRHIKFDMSPLFAGASGQYHQDTDQINAYVDPSSQMDISTVGHEAIHRGLEDLRKSGQGSVPDYLDELTVRAIMDGLYHGPERIDMPQSMATQLDHFQHPQNHDLLKLSQEMADQMAQASRNAAQLVAQRRPGGPR